MNIDVNWNTDTKFPCIFQITLSL